MCSEDISSLPLETLEYIFSLLNHEDLVPVTSVCKRWYEIVNEFLLQNKKCAILRPEINDYLPRHPLQRLSLIDFKGSQFNLVNELVTDIQRLHIGYGSYYNLSKDDGFENLLKSCVNLEELYLRNVSVTDSLLKCITSSLDYFKVKSLTFDCPSLDSEKAKEVLEAILFREVKVIVRYPEKDEAKLLARYPLLNTTIDVKIPKFITTIEMDCSELEKNCYNCFNDCKKVKCLQLLNAFNFNDEAMKSIITYLPDLECVKFTDATDVTAAGWKSLFSRPGILEVTLSRCESGLSDSVFEEAKAASSRLKLDLQNCKRVTAEGLKSAIKLTERFSVTLDYNEQLLQTIEDCVTLGNAPRLQCLDITVQRIHATSSLVSRYLETFQTTLENKLSQLGIQFKYRELTSVMARSR